MQLDNTIWFYKNIILSLEGYLYVGGNIKCKGKWQKE